MFRDDRPFRGIIFSSETLKSVDGVRDLLPAKTVQEADNLRKCPGGVIQHFYYYSPQPFTRNIELLERARKRFNGKMQFRYNFYAVGIFLESGLRIMVAVPFLRMAKEVFSYMRAEMRGEKYQFEKFLLDKAINVSQTGKGASLLLRFTSVKYDVTADTALESVTFVGDELAKSSTHARFVEATTKRGASLTPQSLRLSFDDRFTFTTDNFGHFHFRISKNASNLMLFPDVTRTLDTISLFDRTSVFPHMQHFDKPEETEAD